MKHPQIQIHAHNNGMLGIDHIAQQSTLRNVAPGIKILFTIMLLVLCIAGNSPTVAILIVLMMFALTVWIGGVPLVSYFRLMRIPAAFLVIGCIVILIQATFVPTAYPSLHLLGIYFFITPVSAQEAGTLFLEAYGAIACLYFLSLTTPMQEIIGTLEKAYVPALLIELMYLIYRYIFVLLEQQRSMSISAASRLGNANFKASWYSFTHITGNLLASSFRRSSVCFDAMESRCYDGRIAFLIEKTPIKKTHIVLFIALAVAVVCTLIFVKSKGWDLF
ncbi:MAG: cobalt ECF transporter T component CbiQ [Clostridia bacterium]